MSGALRERISGRRPLEGHVGESGAVLEHALLDGDTPIILKHIDRDSDLTMRLTDDAGRAVTLFASGVLDRLRPGVEHGVLDVWREGEGCTIAMRDVSSGLIALDQRVTTEQLRRTIRAVADIHAAYWGVADATLTPLRLRLELMSPKLMARYLDAGVRMPTWILAGWEALWQLVPDDVAAAVAAIHSDVEPLQRQLEAGGTTLLHGDLWLQNVSLLDDEVVLIDWSIATQGPPAVEWGYFLALNWWQVDLTHEAVIDLVLEAEGDHLDARDMQLGLLWALSSYGWNKAYHAMHNTDPDVQRREADDLAWWIDAGRRALELWSPV